MFSPMLRQWIAIICYITWCPCVSQVFLSINGDLDKDGWWCPLYCILDICFGCPHQISHICWVQHPVLYIEPLGQVDNSSQCHQDENYSKFPNEIQSKQIIEIWDGIIELVRQELYGNLNIWGSAILMTDILATSLLSFKYDFIQFCVDNTEVFQP